MASIKLKLRKGKKDQFEDGSYPIILLVVKDRKSTEIRLGYKVLEIYWDDKNQRLFKKPKHPQYALLQAALDKKFAAASETFYTLEVLNPNWTFNDFKKLFSPEKTEVPNGLFFIFLSEQIEILKIEDRPSDVNSFKALESVLSTMKYPPVYFSDITVQWLEQLKTEYKKKGQAGRNTFRNLRTLFNRAISVGWIDKSVYPFGLHGFSIGKHPKQEKGLSIGQLKLLTSFEPSHEMEKMAIDYFLLMFHLIGMEWRDVTLLKKQNLRNDRVEYYRAKTGAFFSVKINPQAQTIIQKYSVAKKPTDFLFPFIMNQFSGNKTAEYRLSRNGMRFINKYLLQVKLQLGFEEDLTTKVARYSWASIARNEMNVPTELIQDSLGHTDIKVTQQYAKSRGNKEVDLISQELSRLFI